MFKYRLGTFRKLPEKIIVQKLIFFVGCLLFVACSSMPFKTEEHDNSSALISSGLKKQTPPPWQLWSFKRDLDGNLITHPTIIAGDDATQFGQFNEGLKLYSIAAKQNLSHVERKNNTLRIASALLSLNRAPSALKVLGKYLNENNLKPEDVDFSLSLMLGYAYGLSRNYDQSFAWFSQTKEIVSDSTTLNNTTNNAISYVLRRIPERDFEAAIKPWLLDNRFSGLVMEEAERRSLKLEGMQPNTPSHDPNLAGNSFTNSQNPAHSNFLLLAPTTGQHSVLGVSINNGVSLALQNANLPLTLFDRVDTGSSPANLNPVITDDLISSHSLIIGPLLHEHVMTVSAKAIGINTPIIHLSKNDSLKNGGQIIPFGVSPQSQCEQLAKKAISTLNLSTFVIVHPNDKSGQEFGLEFQKAVLKYGGKVVAIENYPKGDTSRSTIIADRLQKLSYDGIFIPDKVEMVSNILSLTNQNGQSENKNIPGLIPNTKPTVLGVAYWSKAKEILQSSAILDGAVFVAPFFVDSTRKEIVDFVSKYKEKFGKTPDLLAAQSYDLAQIAIRALQYSKEQTNSSISESLFSIEKYLGVTGQISVDVQGIINREYDVLRFKNGIFENL